MAMIWSSIISRTFRFSWDDERVEWEKDEERAKLGNDLNQIKLLKMLFAQGSSSLQISLELFLGNFINFLMIIARLIVLSRPMELNKKKKCWRWKEGTRRRTFRALFIFFVLSSSSGDRCELSEGIPSPKINRFLSFGPARSMLLLTPTEFFLRNFRF